MTIGLVIKRKELLQEVESCCAQLGNQILVEKNDCAAWSTFQDWLQSSQPQILIIDVAIFQNIVSDRIRQVKAASPSAMIIAVNTSSEPEPILEAMRAGVEEYFYLPLQKGLHDVLHRKLDQHMRNQFLTNADRRTLAFLSAKGGCGGTTIACHTAVELGKRMHQTGTHHVLLADLDVTGGNVRFIMRAKTPYSVLDAMGNSQGLDVASWNKLISNGYPGLEIISGPGPVRLERMPEQREVERVLNYARSRYQWVVLDLGCTLTPYTMNILESINELFLVASPDVLSLFQVKQILQELRANDYPIDRVRLILNRSGEYDESLVADEAKKMLGIPVHLSMPNDYSGLSEAYAEGRLLAHGSALRKQISALASSISGLEDQENLKDSKQHWFRKRRTPRLTEQEALG